MYYKPKPGYSILLNFITLIYLFLYHNVNKEVREQPLGASCVFPHCGSLILNPDQQAWWQVPSPLSHLSCLIKINNPNQSFPTWEYQNEFINIITFLLLQQQQQNLQNPVTQNKEICFYSRLKSGVWIRSHEVKGLLLANRFLLQAMVGPLPAFPASPHTNIPCHEFCTIPVLLPLHHLLPFCGPVSLLRIIVMCRSLLNYSRWSIARD